MNNQQLQGCKDLTKQIVALLDDFIKNIVAHKDTTTCAQSIKHDLEILIKFVGEETPKWINTLLELCTNHAKNPGINRAEIIKIRGDIEHYSWDDFPTNIDSLNYDKIFIEEAAAVGLNDAIDRLIDCLQIIRDEPTFKLNKSTKSDIDNLINGLNNSKGTSESAIRIWTESGWAFIKTFIPHADKLEALNDFINKTPDAFNEISLKIIDAKNKSVLRIKDEFYVKDHLILPHAEDRKQIESEDK